MRKIGAGCSHNECFILFFTSITATLVRTYHIHLVYVFVLKTSWLHNRNLTEAINTLFPFTPRYYPLFSTLCSPRPVYRSSSYVRRRKCLSWKGQMDFFALFQDIFHLSFFDIDSLSRNYTLEGLNFALLNPWTLWHTLNYRDLDLRSRAYYFQVC